MRARPPAFRFIVLCAGRVCSRSLAVLRFAKFEAQRAVVGTTFPGSLARDQHVRRTLSPTLSRNHHTNKMMILSQLVALGALLTGPPCSRRERLRRAPALSQSFRRSRPTPSTMVRRPPKASGVAYGEALQAAKDYKYAARPVAGNEGEAFKAAEKKRAEAKARIEAGGKAKEESAAETMARLGLKAAS